MAITTVRPNAYTTSAGAPSTSTLLIGGGSATHHAAQSDTSDATYSYNAAAPGYAQLYLDFGSAGLTATQRVKQVRMRVRAAFTSSMTGYMYLALYKSEALPGYLTWGPAFSQVATTFTSGWFTTTSDGEEWTDYADTLVLWEVWNNVGSANGLRVYETYLDLDVRDLLTLATPTITNTGTQRPTITWSTTLNAEADPQKKYEIFVYPQSSYTAGGFSPGVPVGSGGQPWTWTSGQVTSTTNTVQVGADLTYGTTYRVYMRAAQDYNASDWWTAYANDSGFTIALPGDATPLPATPTLTRTVDEDRARITLALAETLNLLTANQSSAETDTAGWAAGSNTTIARHTTAPNAAHGLAKLSLTRTGSTGNATATTPTGTNGFRVLGSQQYTALASFRTAVTARTCKVRVLFYDSAGTYLSSDDLLSAGVSDATGSWTATTVTGTSPATAYYAALELQALSAVASEVHYADKIGIHAGSSTTWTYGGYLTASTTEIQVDYQQVLGTNYLPANVADSGDTLGSTVGFHKRTSGDLLDLYAGAALAGEHSLRWGPSAAASVLDVGFLTTSPNYEVAPLVAPGQAMTGSAYVRAQTGTFQVALIVGVHNAAGSVTSVTGSTATVGTDWTRITATVTVPDSGLYGYVAFDNTADTTTGRLLIDRVQLEVGSSASTWVGGSGDRPDEWTTHRSSPILGTSLPVEQQTWLHDYEAQAHRSIRIYRVRSQVADNVGGSSTLTTAYVYAAAYQTIEEGVWWFKDLLQPSLNWSTRWVLDTAEETIAEDVDTVHPLGRPYPVSVSSWISSGSDGSLQVRTSGEADWLALERLLRRQNALLLQSSGGLNKYIRLASRAWPRRGHRNALQRVVSLSYTEEGSP